MEQSCVLFKPIAHQASKAEAKDCEGNVNEALTSELDRDHQLRRSFGCSHPLAAQND